MASEVGTFVHEQTENYFQHGFFDTVYSFCYKDKVESVSVEREKQQFLHFVSDYAIKPYRQEWPVFDIDLNIAGTIDLICRESDGEFVIYDWKRSRKVVDAQEILSSRPLVVEPPSMASQYLIRLSITTASSRTSIATCCSSTMALGSKP